MLEYLDFTGVQATFATVRSSLAIARSTLFQRTAGEDSGEDLGETFSAPAMVNSEQPKSQSGLAFTGKRERISLPVGTTMKTLLLILMAAAALAMTSANAAETTPTSGVSEVTSAATNKLNILWTSQDKEVALKMVFMYALNAKKQGWWKEVQLIIWGPSARLTATDKEIQDYLKRLSEAGVVVVACRACADQYGVSKALEELGVEVKYMGRPLTDILKRGEKLMTL